MKIKFLAFALVLCLIAACLCACGGNEANPTDAPDSTPSASQDAADTSPEETDAPAEPTDKGLFVTEVVDPLLTFPEHLQDQTLPIDFFEDDPNNVAVPVTKPDPEATEEPTDPPAPTTDNPNHLPEDVFDEDTLPPDMWDE